MEQLKKELSKILIAILKEKGYETENIENADFISELGMDSITHIIFIIEIESFFGVEVTDDLLLIEKFRCLDDIALWIEREQKLLGGCHDKSMHDSSQ